MRIGISIAFNLACWFAAWQIGSAWGPIGLLVGVVVFSLAMHIFVPAFARRWISRLVSRELAARITPRDPDLPKAHDAICFHGSPGLETCACPCHDAGDLRA